MKNHTCILVLIAVLTIAVIPDLQAQQPAKSGKEKKSRKPATTEQTAKPANTAMNEDEAELMQKLFGGDITYDQQYEFQSSYTFEVTTVQADLARSKVVYEMAASPAGNAYLIEVLLNDGKKPEPHGRMIFDLANRSLVSLIDDGGDRNGIAMLLDPESVTQKTVQVQSKGITKAENVEFRKTGEVREINGFRCEQYSYSSPEAYGEMWVSDASELQGAGFFGMFGYGQKKHKSYTGLPGYPKGFIMEMSTTDQTTRDRATMKVTSIDLEKEQLVKVTEYQMISMGKIMGQ